MSYIALQIDGKWAVLPDDTSLSIEGYSPLWGEGGGAFSYPFSIGVEENRHILENIDRITGKGIFKVLNRRRAVIYVLGIPLVSGVVALDETVEITDGRIDLSVVSGTLEFDELIEGMSCRDVEIPDRIVLGERVTDFKFVWRQWSVNNVFEYESDFPSEFMWMSDGGTTTVNVTDAYPVAKYCNARICYPLPEEETSREDKKDDSLNVPVVQNVKRSLTDLTAGPYVVLDADRANSAPCFYVLYFLECLFRKLDIAYDMSSIIAMEDMTRLSFFNTRCSYREENTNTLLGHIDLQQKVSGFTYSFTAFDQIAGDYVATIEAPLKKCLADAGNFPSSGVDEVVRALETGFGIRFLFDSSSRKMRMVFLKDVLRDRSVTPLSMEVHEVPLEQTNITGIRMQYEGADENSTDYNYDDWSRIIQVNSYNAVVVSVSPYNKNLYIDTRNGNAYRVKVDEDAKEESELHPTLFEVGAFNPVEYGDCSDDDTVEEIGVNFIPVICNDVSYSRRRSVLDSNNRTGGRVEGSGAGTRAGSGRTGGRGIHRDGSESAVTDDENNQEELAVYLDVSMKKPAQKEWITLKGQVEIVDTSHGRTDYEESEFRYSYFSEQNFEETASEPNYTAQRYKGVWRENVVMNARQNYTRFPNDVYKTMRYVSDPSPLQQFDPGLSFGVMRGPGNQAGVERYAQDYDGEGNWRWVTTPKNYTYDSDCVDNYARAYDYNGTMTGGVDPEGRFSLKLRAEKPDPDSAGGHGLLPISQSYCQRRGLFDKFYTEYAWFVLHRRVARFVGHVELADIVNIDWTKRYRVGDVIGFVKGYSFSVSKEHGISDITLELYYVNDAS